MRVVLASLVLLLLTVSPAHGGCTPLESFTLETDWYGGVTVPVNINGKPVRLLVDTGGVNSMLTATTVETLGLVPQPIRNSRVTLYGGLQLTRFVRTAAAAGGASGPSDFYVMPDNRIPYALSGTLAPDFLSRFDVEFDFKGAAMRLNAPGSCPDGTGVPLVRDSAHHLIVPVVLDGKTVAAMLDTGASRSDMSLETARELFGADLKLEKANRDDAEAGLFTHGFKNLSIGGVTVKEPDIVVVPDDISRRPKGSPRLILGMGVLRRLHLTISYVRQQITLANADTP